MPDIEFPYSSLGGTKIPLIPVRVHLPREILDIPVFVDSGATYTIIRAEEIRGKGFDFKKGTIKRIQVGDGNYIHVYLHQLTIEIGTRKIQAAVGFSEKMKIAFNILGRKDIFETFKVCFNDKAAKITFHEL